MLSEKAQERVSIHSVTKSRAESRPEAPLGAFDERNNPFLYYVYWYCQDVSGIPVTR